MSLRRFGLVAVFGVGLVGASLPAGAQQLPQSIVLTETVAQLQQSPLVGPAALAQAQTVSAQQTAPAPLGGQQTLPAPASAAYRSDFRSGGHRPAWFFGVHAVTAVMQGLDAHSTLEALNSGAVELNPMAKAFVEHQGAFTAMKVGVAAGLIYTTDRMAKDHPVRALLTAAAVNSAYAMIVANNYRNARR
jgi:hypothetical protein